MSTRSPFALLAGLLATAIPFAVLAGPSSDAVHAKKTAPARKPARTVHPDGNKVELWEPKTFNDADKGA